MSDFLVPKRVPRHQIDTLAWDACVALSAQRVLYGYSWYLDAVLPAPDWQWEGLVLFDEKGSYKAVMPIPLRRKGIAGLMHRWVVHQPFFCQFLAVFSVDEVDTDPFLEAVSHLFRYGTKLCLRQVSRRPVWAEVSQLATHILDLSADYATLFQNYSRDRKLNLRRAEAANWTVVESTDLQPLLNLFRINHAETIDGGVADWAYALFDRLGNELMSRGFGILYYAAQQGRIEAGALFVREGNRIIYLFNAASATGRTKNARTLLIDQVIRAYAGTNSIFDFESPVKSSIVDFYRSFGASEEPFYNLRWNRLTALERGLIRLRHLLS
ncbi:GNAT family N-acetyltransferase [Spirosoma sp. SC4-14]|uniref:GNAT family N-acetyltransferase n=1 Tax=Spirosoma sp. SC4-14 TaxID=3128900 RepID=UPI0030D43971